MRDKSIVLTSSPYMGSYQYTPRTGSKLRFTAVVEDALGMSASDSVEITITQTETPSIPEPPTPETTVSVSVQLNKSSLNLGESITGSYSISEGATPYEIMGYFWSVYSEESNSWVDMEIDVLTSTSGSKTFTPTSGSKVKFTVIVEDANGVVGGDEKSATITIATAPTKVPDETHWYGQWAPNGEEQHAASCLFDGCDLVANIACEFYGLTVNGSEASVCPVCGRFGNLAFKQIAGTAAQSADGTALPKGELLVRGMALPFGSEAVQLNRYSSEQASVLYAFTAGYEYFGQMQEQKGTVTMNVPVAIEDTFSLIRVSKAEGEDGSEYAFTEMDYNLANRILTFGTDQPALYLLIAKD